MTLRIWLLAMAGALVMGLAGSSAQAAPAGGGPAAALKGEASRNSAVEKTDWRRRCWYHRGHRHCRWQWYDDYYDPPYYGPGIGFFFGPGHHHRGHGHHGHRGHFNRGGGHRGHGHHGGRGRH
jgi:hypothetical protein